jgi:hypothetical protein
MSSSEICVWRDPCILQLVSPHDTSAVEESTLSIVVENEVVESTRFTTNCGGSCFGGDAL